MKESVRLAEESDENTRTVVKNACVRDLLFRAAQHRQQVVTNNHDEHLHHERLCLEEAATKLTEESTVLSTDVGACFVVHARLADIYHQLGNSTTVDDESCLSTRTTNTSYATNSSMTTNVWEQQADEAATVAIKMYTKVFDGRTQYRKDRPYHRLKKFVNTLLLRDKSSPQDNPAAVAKVVYAKRALKDVRNCLRMRGTLDSTPWEMASYRGITDNENAVSDDIEHDECEDDNMQETIMVSMDKMTSKERRKQLRKEKFGQQAKV